LSARAGSARLTTAGLGYSAGVGLGFGVGLGDGAGELAFLPTRTIPLTRL
jgi:hypothetical protein